jgi:MraZ protein
MGFRPADWRTFVDTKLAPLPQQDPVHRMRVRFLLGGAHECELDRQGRVLVPAPLLDYAGLRHECVVLGVNERLEIWSAAAWKEYLPADAALEKFAAELGI